jgi:hypothetical protein
MLGRTLGTRFAPWIALVLLAFAFGGCSAPTKSAPAPRVDAQRAEAAPPDWRFEPLSWTKLERIERWLEGPGTIDASRKSEAEVELAEGLLEYARLERAKLGEATFEARLDRAEDLLQAALGSDATSSQLRERATSALAKVLIARLGVPAPAPVAAAPTAPNPGGFPELITRPRWGSLPANRVRLERHSGAWEKLTVHHSADGNGELAEQSATDSARAVRNIQRYHMQDAAHRWGDIGYHFLIDPLGRIYEGRSLQWQGAHAGNNALNQHNIGVCMLGQYAQEPPPPLQLQALDRLVDALRARYKIPAAKVVGHLELKDTDCPGPFLLGWVKRYRASAGAADASAPLTAAVTSEAAAPGRSAKTALPAAKKLSPKKKVAPKSNSSKPSASGVQ